MKKFIAILLFVIIFIAGALSAGLFLNLQDEKEFRQTEETENIVKVDGEDINEKFAEEGLAQNQLIEDATSVSDTEQNQLALIEKYYEEDLTDTDSSRIFRVKPSVDNNIRESCGEVTENILESIKSDCRFKPEILEIESWISVDRNDDIRIVSDNAKYISISAGEIENSECNGMSEYHDNPTPALIYRNWEVCGNSSATFQGSTEYCKNFGKYHIKCIEGFRSDIGENMEILGRVITIRCDCYYGLTDEMIGLE